MQCNCCLSKFGWNKRNWWFSKGLAEWGNSISDKRKWENFIRFFEDWEYLVSKACATCYRLSQHFFNILCKKITAVDIHIFLLDIWRRKYGIDGLIIAKATLGNNVVFNDYWSSEFKALGFWNINTSLISLIMANFCLFWVTLAHTGH